MLFMMFWVCEIRASPWKPGQRKGHGVRMTESALLFFVLGIDTSKIERKEKVTVLFCTVPVSHIGNDTAVCGRSLASPLSPSCKISVNVKMSVEDWRNYSNGWNRSTSRKTCPSATFRVKNVT